MALVDKSVTGPRGGVTTTDRSRGSDGLVDKTVTGPKGGVTTVDRARGADGAVDKTVVGPHGGVTTVDRSRGADGVNRQDGHRPKRTNDHDRSDARRRRRYRCNGHRPERDTPAQSIAAAASTAPLTARALARTEAPPPWIARAAPMD